MLATSENAINLQKLGFTMHLMTWQARHDVGCTTGRGEHYPSVPTFDTCAEPGGLESEFSEESSSTMAEDGPASALEATRRRC